MSSPDTTTTHDTRVIEIDEALLHRGLWAVAGIGLVVVLLTSSGAVLAVAAAAAVGAVAWKAWSENEVRHDFRESMDDVWTSASRSVVLLGFDYDATRTRRHVTEGEIVAGDAVVRIEQHPGDVTRIRVRVGTFPLPDNRRRAALIVQRIAQGFETTEEIPPSWSERWQV